MELLLTKKHKRARAREVFNRPRGGNAAILQALQGFSSAGGTAAHLVMSHTLLLQISPFFEENVFRYPILLPYLWRIAKYMKACYNDEQATVRAFNRSDTGSSLHCDLLVKCFQSLISPTW